MATPAPAEAAPASEQQFVKMSDEEAIYQEEVATMEKRGRRLRRAALTAGIMQAVTILCSIYSTIAVRWVLMEWDSAERTVGNVFNSLGMFNFGILTDGVVTVTDTLVGVLVGLILIGAGVNPATSTLIIVFKVLQQAVMAVALVFMLVTRLFVDSEEYYSLTFPMLLINKYAVIFAQVFSGIHLALLGFTIIMWGVFPRFMGYVVFAAGPCVIINTVLYVILPDYDGELGLLFSLPRLVAEFWLAGWLLVNVPHPAKNREFLGLSFGNVDPQN